MVAAVLAAAVLAAAARAALTRGEVLQAAAARAVAAARVAVAAPAYPGSTPGAPVVRAGQAADWEPLGPAASITRLFTPASGPLFAATAAELLRSDDAGATWTQVGLPGPRRENAAIEVDPTDPLNSVIVDFDSHDPELTELHRRLEPLIESLTDFRVVDAIALGLPEVGAL